MIIGRYHPTGAGEVQVQGRQVTGLPAPSGAGLGEAIYLEPHREIVDPHNGQILYDTKSLSAHVRSWRSMAEVKTEYSIGPWRTMRGADAGGMPRARS